MPQHVAVVFVHGIFANAIQYSVPMQKQLLKLLPQELHRYLDFEEVFWAGLVRGRQSAYMKNAITDADIVENRLRTFFIQGLGDAAAYQKTRRRENSIYHQVHDAINDTLDRFDRGIHKNTPLVFIGHSLGSHIISSYVWDLNKLKQVSEDGLKGETEEARHLHEKMKHATPFRRLDTLAGLVTFGSNIPLFTFTFGPARIYPLTRAPDDDAGGTLKPAFPGDKLPATLQQNAQWLNFYSKRDVLGYPLKPLNEYFGGEPRIEDICVRSESRISRILPYWSNISAHTGYWTNATVLSRTAALIRNIVEAPAIAQQSGIGNQGSGISDQASGIRDQRSAISDQGSR
jgi:hypothetical protein